MSWVRWLESKKVISTAPDETVLAATRRMAEHDIGALLVVDGGAPLGIFSERDLLKRVVAEGRDPAATPVAEVCSTEVATVGERDDPATCARLIRGGGFRHLPVVDDAGRPLGILSARDFLQQIADELGTLLGKSYRGQRSEERVDPFGSRSFE